VVNAVVLEHVSKQYRLGHIQQFGMLQDNMAAWLRRLLGQEKMTQEVLWALNDISLEIKHGEVVGIIGRNGAGKSTLLKILSKITFPTTGAMKVNGRVASLLEVGTGFHEELTGRENVILNGSILGMPRAEITRQMDAIVDFAGVEKFIDTPIKRYSSGMRLRLGFAVAAHLNPDILIIDEVLAVGDAGFQKKCLGAMETLRNSGRTVLFVSHNMAAVENLCSRVIWIDNGRIRQDGETSEVIQSYMGSFSEGKRTGFDLDKIQARRGSGGARLTSLEFFDRAGAPLKLVRSGDPLIIRFWYDAKERVANPIFGIRVYTELGTLVTEMNTWMTDFEIPFIDSGKGYIDLIVDFLNLMPGRYSVTLFLGAVGPLFQDLLDHCGILEIEASDFYNSGKGIEGRFGVMFLPFHWERKHAGDETMRDIASRDERKYEMG
jgi:lipopolysaccharide transport system ATP-binding protein